MASAHCSIFSNMPPGKELEKRERSDSKESLIKKEEAKVPEFLGDLPPEVKEVLGFGLTMRNFSGSHVPSIVSKINERHIDKVLDLAKDDSDKDYKANLWNLGMRISIIAISIGLFMFLTFYFGRTDKELYLDLVKVIAAFLGGIGIGYGLKSKKG